MTRCYVGADLSKEWIDTFHPSHNSHVRIANRKPAIRRFLRSLSEDEVLVFEATSGCDDTLLSVIRAENAAFFRANPAHAWYFARACNLPKTDRVDAKMLSAFGAARKLEPQRTNSLARERLKSLVRRRRQYKDMITQEKNRQKRVTEPDLKRDVRSLLNLFERRVEELERKIQDHLRTHDELRSTGQIIASTPGIGAVATSVLIADMPELGVADRRQIVSLAGLAPRAYESGKFKAPRRLGAGRRHVRKVLYMAALSVIAQGKLFRPFITRMKSEGKANKAIIMAVARKLLVIVNTLVRNQTSFDFKKIAQSRNPQ
ncbi:MAG: IS110 family transposase [Pseudomonadota bacterium]